MDRLSFILKINPSWGLAIQEFVMLNPEFGPFLKYAALKGTADVPEELKTIRDMLLYYVSFAGVNTSYGQKAWQWVKTGQLDKLTPKKRSIIENILALPTITTIKEFDKIDIKGVGEGAQTFVRQFYFNDTNIIYPTDRIFQKGMCLIYHLDKVSVGEAKHLANQWKGQKSVGSMFCFQAANYATPLSIKPQVISPVTKVTNETKKELPVIKMTSEIKEELAVKKMTIKMKGELPVKKITIKLKNT